MGRAVKPSMDTYTVALPWYEREDFSRIWLLAHDRAEMPSDYEEWHRNAVAVMHAWLARGRALEIVTIRPDEFLEWLRMRELPNTAETRRRYVEELASRSHNVA